MLTSPLITVPHGFTTREGGVSSGPYAGLNLGLSTADDPALVEQNRQMVLKRFGNPALAELNQVHGNAVHIAQGAGTWEGDGLLSNTPGVLLRVGIADCYPILLHDPVQGVVGALHAGWRGVVSEILPRALELMTERFASSPADIRVAVGPGISGPRFQVGPEVVEEFRAKGLENYRLDPNQVGKYLLDLEGSIRQQALALGVLPHNYWALGLCTVSDQRFFSHRRDKGITGRMWAVIMAGGGKL